jgi:anti-sigma B factor antagonist
VTACAIRVEETEEDVHVLRITGGLGLATAPELKRELLAAAADGASLVVADLARATVLDSTPLGVLLAVSKLLGQAGVALTVVVDGPMLRFVRRFGLEDLLQVVEAEAVDGSVRRSPAVADVA